MSQAAAPVPAAAPAPTVPSQSAAPKKTAAKKVAAKKRAASPKKKATTQIAKIPAERTGKTAQIISIVQANVGRKGISARAIIKELGPQTPVQANATKRLIKSLVDKQILTAATGTALNGSLKISPEETAHAKSRKSAYVRKYDVPKCFAKPGSTKLKQTANLP